MKLLKFVGVLMLVYAYDAMKITKQTSITFDDEDQYTTPDIARLLGLTGNSLATMDDDQYDFTGCSKGKCEVCKSVVGQKLCLEAVLLKQGFSVEVKIGGKQVFKKEVTIATPPPICISKIPGLDKLSDLCLKLDKVDLTKKSACAEITVKVKVGPVKKNLKVDLGCFTIPAIEDNNGEAILSDDEDAKIDMEDIREPFDITNNETEALDNYLDDTTSDVDLTINDLTEDTTDFGMVTKGCSKGKCEVCKGVIGLKMCLEAVLLKQGFSVEVKVDGKQVFKKEVTIATPPPICISKIPGLDKLSDLCLKLDKVDLTKKSACAEITVKAKIGPVRKTIKVKLGCFSIPVLEETAIALDNENDALKFVPHLPDSPVEASSETISLIDDDVAALIEELLADSADEFDIDLEGVLKRCKDGKCTLCTPGKHLKLCVIAAYLPKGVLELAVSVAGKQVYHYDISVTNPPPFCFNYMHISGICLQVYNIDLKQRSACVRVSFKVLAKKINIKLGCFKIPHADVEILSPDTVWGIN